ncbi:hypothetical protein [Hydrogenimonas cancrithermarum]|uniref:Beta-lactamase n=1 Tax=Hydrogenimonas cancrithermarum TaxID=2993563 RepID=A0ABN6WTK8_9BACT|nr:hypothetical protein [Hydrogenimonas cancrithermarum]BDY12394.1 hypothetical protein HCR_07060 [Hydrogenimonas cancrithermarum]
MGFFNFGKKKTSDNPLTELIKEVGFHKAAEEAALVLTKHLGGNKNIALEFILAELDAASRGDKDSSLFAIQSGIHIEEFRGSINREMSASAEKAQNIMNKYSIALLHDKHLAGSFRREVIDFVMKMYKLGKYQKEEYSRDEQIKNLIMKYSLKELSEIADNGNVYAQIAMWYSLMVMKEEGVEVDDASILDWMSLAADNGDGESANEYSIWLGHKIGELVGSDGEIETENIPYLNSLLKSWLKNKKTAIEQGFVKNDQDELRNMQELYLWSDKIMQENNLPPF